MVALSFHHIKVYGYAVGQYCDYDFFVYIFLQRVGSLPNTANSSTRTSGKIMISRSFSGRSHVVAGSIA